MRANKFASGMNNRDGAARATASAPPHCLCSTRQRPERFHLTPDDVQYGALSAPRESPVQSPPPLVPFRYTIDFIGGGF